MGDRLWQWRCKALEHARQNNVPPEEVDWLLREMAGLNTLALRLGSYRHQTTLKTSVSLSELERLWQQRLLKRVPVQYLVGYAPWRNFTLRVSPGVLIPRPETEQIIDLAIASTERSPHLRAGHWVDLGTGSGAIALGLAEVFPEATIHAVDCSEDAMAIARDNAERHGLGDRIQFYHGSWFTPMQHLRGQLAGLVSNPPYIPSHQIHDLQPEVTQHEPHLALDGGIDGLDCIRTLAQTASDYLRSGGLWLVEMMYGQAALVQDVLKQYPYRDISIHYDLAGIERFALAYRQFRT